MSSLARSEGSGVEEEKQQKQEQQQGGAQRKTKECCARATTREGAAAAQRLGALLESDGRGLRATNILTDVALRGFLGGPMSGFVFGGFGRENYRSGSLSLWPCDNTTPLDAS